MKKMRSRWLGLAVAATAVLAACGSSSSNKTSTPAPAKSTNSTAVQSLKLLNYPSSTLGWIGYVAEQKGYFTQNHLKVDLVSLPAGAQATNALVGGSLDVAILDPTNLAPLLAKGQKFQLLLGEIKTDWAMLVQPSLANQSLKSVITSVSTVGAPSVGGAGGRLAQYLADQYGNTSTLSVVADLTGSGLIGGHLKATMADPEVGCVVSAQGPKRLFDFYENPSASLGELPASVKSLFGSEEFGYWASTSWVQGHGQAVKDLQAALTQAVSWASDPQNAAALTNMLRSSPYNSTALSPSQFQSCVSNIAPAFNTHFSSADAATWSKVVSTSGIASGGLPPTSQWFGPGLPQ